MKKFSFNSIIRKQSPIFTNVFIEATWKSPHRYISISFDIGIDIAKKFGFAFRIYFLKIEYLCSFLCLVLASVRFCYKYLFLYDFLFIHPKASIGVLEKG